MVGVERGAEPVRVPTVELDGDALLRVGQVDPYLPPGENHPVLLSGRWKPCPGERTKGASLEIAVSRRVAR